MDNTWIWIRWDWTPLVRSPMLHIYKSSTVTYMFTHVYTQIDPMLLTNYTPFAPWRFRNCSHQQLSINLIAAVPSELQGVWTWNAVVGCGFGHVWSHGTCDTPWFAVNHHGLHSAFHADASLRGFICGKRVKSLVETHRRRSRSVQFLQAILYLFHGLRTT